MEKLIKKNEENDLKILELTKVKNELQIEDEYNGTLHSFWKEKYKQWEGEVKKLNEISLKTIDHTLNENERNNWNQKVLEETRKEKSKIKILNDNLDAANKKIEQLERSNEYYEKSAEEN